jgi:hypothetical protein
MLAVTASAREVLGQILANSDPAQEQALRLMRNDNEEFGLALDEERAGDQVVNNGDQTVLLVENALSSELQGVMLDAAQMPDGPALRMVHAEAPPSHNGSTPV